MNESRAVVTDDVVAEVEFLSRSANRVEILKCLLDRETVDRRDLAEECDVVRTTLQRNLDSLVEADLLHQPGLRTYELTAVGAEMARSLVEFVETAHAARRLAPLLKWLPNGAFDLEVRRLADAELVVSEPTDPYATVNRHFEALRGAESFRATLPVVGQRAAETAYERIAAADAHGGDCLDAGIDDCGDDGGNDRAAEHHTSVDETEDSGIPVFGISTLVLLLVAMVGTGLHFRADLRGRFEEQADGRLARFHS